MVLTVITTAATDTLGHIHDRSPLLLPDDLWDARLDPDLTDSGNVDALLHRVPEPHRSPIEVSPAVGNVRNNSPALVEPVAT